MNIKLKTEINLEMSLFEIGVVGNGSWQEREVGKS